MKALIVYNPISGAGRAAAAAEEARRALVQAGHDAASAPTQLARTTEWLDARLAGVDALVVVGGDGAMRLAAPAAMRTGAAVYHLPLGTENLFARHFNMGRSVQTLVGAFNRGDSKVVDTATANGRTFLLMASIGFDAEVVHDLASSRGTSISHWSYVRPIVSQLRRWTPSMLEICVDGRCLRPPCRGFVVVANCPQYGWRLNPGAQACMDDGKLDVVFFPVSSRLGLMRWACRSRLGRHVGCANLTYETGRSVTIRAERPVRYQLDGDPPGEAWDTHDGDEPNGTGSMAVEFLRIEAKPATLRVLTP